MLKNLFFSLAVLSMSFLLVSCGASKKSKIAGFQDMEGNQGITETEIVDAEAIAAQTAQAFPLRSFC